MSVRMLHGTSTSDQVTFACLHDSCTETAFGPVYYGDDADEFATWFAGYTLDLNHAARHQVEDLFLEWKALPKCGQCDERKADVAERVGEHTIGGGGDIEQDVLVECGPQCDDCWVSDVRHMD